MKNKNALTVLALLILVMTYAAAPSPVYACSCRGSATAKDVMEGSDIVFLGKVIRITETTPASPNDYVAFTGREVLFDVITVYKGELKAQYVVHTGNGGGDCGVPFTVGEMTVVFALAWDNQPLRTASCSYLRPEGAPSDEVALGQIGQNILPSKQPDFFSSYSLPIAAVVALAAVIALIVKRRRMSIP